MDQVRYGIIGAGSMGQEHIANLHVIDGAVVTALADPHEGSRAQARSMAPGAQEFTDHRALLDSGLVDAVVIASPNDTHVAVLKDALATDLAVFVEKPLATTVQDCLDIAEWGRARSALTWVGLEYRYMPPVAEVIQRAAAGAVGTVQQVSIREHREPFYPKVDNWNRFSERTGGTLVEKCCHYFNLMDVVLGENPVRVFASGGQRVNFLDEVYEGRPSDMLDSAYVIVEYASGARGMLDLCMFAENSVDKEHLTVIGDEGKLESLLPSLSMRYTRREDYGRKGSWGEINGTGRGAEVKHCWDVNIRYSGHHYGASYIEHEKFLDAFINNKPAEVTLDDGVRSVATGLAAHKSIDEGRPVLLSEILPESFSF
jgi:myo-inositol 2-dehydrogenase / D-chiro-inositol 1-dehydrogenase